MEKFLLLALSLWITLQTVIAGEALADNKWHSVKVKKRGRQIKMKVDQRTQVDAELPGESSLLDHDRIYIGKDGERDYDEEEDFTGQMQRVMMNGEQVVDSAKPGGVIMTAKVHDDHFDSQAVQNAITFDSQAAYIIIKQRIYATFQIHFQLRTTQANCLLFYSGDGGGLDFLVLEVVDGHLHYVFNTGGGIREISLDKGPKVNDNRWHDISILRPVVQKHVLRVDGYSTEDNVLDSRALHFDLDDNLFVGGAERQRYNVLPVQVKVRRGFVGCIASLDINGAIYSLLDHRLHVPLEYRTVVRDGCHALDQQCRPDTCHNGGSCKQSGQGVTCHCDMTTFSGPTCSDESVAYTFSENGGVITHMIPRDRHSEAKKDQFAVGIVTSQKNAILFRVDSVTSPDFIEMEMADGNILVTYNMGTADLQIAELVHKVNDSRYHVVRFHRQGPNSTLQVDNHPILTKHLSGQQTSIFNNQDTIQIGGKRDISGRIVRPFKGTLAGLTFNGIRLLDMVSMNDPSTSISGNVERHVGHLATSEPFSSTIDSMNKHSSGHMLSTMQIINKKDDQLIISNRDCHQQDNENCHRNAAAESDALITVVIQPKPSTSTISSTVMTRRSTTTATPPSSTLPPNKDEETGSGKDVLCDDEECEWGFNSGEDGPHESTTSTSSPSPTPPVIPQGKDDDDIETEIVRTQLPPIKDKQASSSIPKVALSTSSIAPSNPLVDVVNMTEAVTNRHRLDGFTMPPTRIAGSATLEAPRTTSQPKVISWSTSSNDQQEANASGSRDSELNQRSFLSTGLNVALMLGVGFAVLVLIAVLIYAIYKWQSNDTNGKVESSANMQYSYSPCATAAQPILPPSEMYNNNNHAATAAAVPSEQYNGSKIKKRDVKEWYV